MSRMAAMVASFGTFSFGPASPLQPFHRVYIVQMDSKIIIIWVKNNQLFFSES